MIKITGIQLWLLANFCFYLKIGLVKSFLNLFKYLLFISAISSSYLLTIFVSLCDASPELLPCSSACSYAKSRNH